MTINYFEGYFDELKKLKREEVRLLGLKDRSMCPCCESKINKKETNNKLDNITKELEGLEHKKRTFSNKQNELNWIRSNYKNTLI